MKKQGKINMKAFQELGLKPSQSVHTHRDTASKLSGDDNKTYTMKGGMGAT